MANDFISHGNIVKVIITNLENDESWTAFAINKDKKEVVYYPHEENFFVDKITLKGFIRIPKEIMSENGYFLASLGVIKNFDNLP